MFRSSAFGGLTTVTGAAAGLLASVFSTELKSNFPFTLSLPNPWTIFWVWVVIFLFGAMFWAAQWAQSQSNKRGQDALRLAVDDLQSLPPKGYLDEIKKFNRLASAYTAKAQLIQDQLAIEEAIRFILSLLTEASQMYHPQDRDCRYAANILLFLERDELAKMPDAERELIRNRLQFCEGAVLDILKCDGILDMQCQLSVSTDNKEIPDALLDAMAFPVFGITSSAIKRGNTIPGSPSVFESKTPVRFLSQAEVMQAANYQKMQDIPKEELKEYLESKNGQQVLSFLTIPLFSPALDKHETITGVVNIHRNKENIFPGAGIHRFVPVVDTLLLNISHLLEHLSSLKLNSRPIEATTADNSTITPPAD